MTATEELRRLLDDLGVEYEGGERSLRWRDRNGVMMQAFPLADGELGMDVWSCTPEQAIAATLGRGNAGRYVGLRRGEYWERTENSDYYCGGCGWKVTDHDSYCPECGGALHEAALGSCNCSNSERTETCTADETDTWECVCDGIGRYGKRVTVHVMECSECGRTYEHVNGGYEFCPRCRRKVVDE